ncbi:hypothetical protein E2C01_045580 [Portunus trituberculatus]|uniref:Uncharacterized protein n=1 Tax=Portunus trituberculatus TaxID=210409 RepID=A0A5B7G3I2_PORTR|nr:hypothetical protein [Portunus trituberculatus]
MLLGSSSPPRTVQAGREKVRIRRPLSISAIPFPSFLRTPSSLPSPRAFLPPPGDKVRIRAPRDSRAPQHDARSLTTKPAGQERGTLFPCRLWRPTVTQITQSTPEHTPL